MSQINKVPVKIGVKTRFDSTVDMYEIVLQDKSAYDKLQQNNRRKEGYWLLQIHLIENDFDMIRTKFNLHVPVRGATVNLQKLIAFGCDGSSVFTAVHDLLRPEIPSILFSFPFLYSSF